MRQYVETKPYWIDSASLPGFPRLEHDEHADVVIVGAGITGLTTAYLLAKAGRLVAVLERGQVVECDTAQTSAHLTMATDAGLVELIARFGRDHAQAVWHAGLAAIAAIDTIVCDEYIACDFARVPGYEHRPLGDASLESKRTFQDEAALAADLGFDASFIDDVPFVGGPGVVFEDQARIDPLRYLAGLARTIIAVGGHIYQRSAADKVSADPCFVRANGHTISCDDIVLATHTPLMGHTAVQVTHVVGGRVRQGQVPDALFWDTADPYHYLRIVHDRDHDFVIFGGEDHKIDEVVDTNVRYGRLERTLMTMVPSIDVTHRWSGQVIETPDGLPYIGVIAPHQFAATGFSGNGLTFGTLAATMAADRILGRDNPWRELFDVGRTKIRAAAWNCHGPRFKGDGALIGGSAESPLPKTRD